MKKNCQSYFCSNPFENALIDEHGDVFLCCQPWLSMPIGNLLTHSWEEVWNGPVAQSIRETIHDGSYAYCNSLNCPYLQGQPGRFQKKEDVTDPYFKDIIARRSTTLDRGPSTVVISYDPTCNLACPSCRCGYIVVKGESFERAQLIHERVWEAALDHADVLYITGMGDPFSSRLYRRILREFDASRFPDLDIGLITNGLLLTPGMWESISASHEAIKSIYISVNAGSAKSFEVNQQGGSWDKLLENLEFVKGLRQRKEIEMFSLGFFAHENNFHEMVDFVHRGKALGADMVDFRNMQNWNTYTDDAFANIAVHLEGHPRHHEFLEVLKDPIFKDPICRMGNLSSLLPNAVAPTQTPSFDSHEAVTADEFTRWLMVDELQKGTVIGLLNQAKENVVEALSMAPVSGGPSPVERLAQLQWAQAPDIGQQIEAYLRTAQHPASQRPYIEVIQEIDQRGAAALKALLEPWQVAAFDLVHDRPLHDIDTGQDPLGARVYAHIETLRNQAQGGVASSNAANGAACHGVVTSPETLAVLREFRDGLVALYGRVPASGQASPLDYLADGLRERRKTAQRDFVAYAGRERDPGSGLSYLQAARKVEAIARERLKRVMRAEDRGALPENLPESLLSLDIGYDPFGAALRERITKCAL